MADNVYAKILEDIIGMIASAGLSLYSAVTVGALPANDGISMEYASGALSTQFSSRRAVENLTLVINAKHHRQDTALDALGKIHKYLTTRTTYPVTVAYQIANIATYSAPNYAGREENGQYLYVSAVTVRVLIK